MQKTAGGISNFFILRVTMSQSASTPTRAAQLTATRQRIWMLVGLAAVLVIVSASEGLHAWLMEGLSMAQAVIRARPVLGGLVFILFAALSAMLAFVSSAVIVPVGVYVWGTVTSMLLLWAGWILGGVCAYSISRYLGRSVVKALSSTSRLERYESLISHHASFGLVLLFQTALPSEVPGYVLGFARYSFWKYLCALALAELPYAVATVYLGASFIERRTYLLIGVGMIVLIFSGWALYTLHRRVAGKTISPAPAPERTPSTPPAVP
jgi:uncharacterized membrane protein YdjX (TVP38/TMEM64 family)